MRIFLLFFSLSITSSFADPCNTAPDSSRVTVAGGSITEILYVLGAENQVIAVDSTSNFPPEARNHRSVGYVRNLSTEGILSLEPTLIIAEDDVGPPEVLAQIRVTGVDVAIVEEHHSILGVLEKINCVASIVGKSEIANRYIDKQLKPVIAELEQLTGAQKLSIKVLFILGLQSGSPIVAGLDTSANGLIEMIGASNSMSSFGGWRPVSAEAIINAQPDVILISQRGVNSFGGLDAVNKHSALRNTPAVKNSKVIAMDGMAMLGFGPRTIDTALSLAKKIAD